MYPDQDRDMPCAQHRRQLRNGSESGREQLHGRADRRNRSEGRRGSEAGHHGLVLSLYHLFRWSVESCTSTIRDWRLQVQRQFSKGRDKTALPPKKADASYRGVHKPLTYREKTRRAKTRFSRFPSIPRTKGADNRTISITYAFSKENARAVHTVWTNTPPLRGRENSPHPPPQPVPHRGVLASIRPARAFWDPPTANEGQAQERARRASEPDPVDRDGEADRSDTREPPEGRPLRSPLHPTRHARAMIAARSRNTPSRGERCRPQGRPLGHRSRPLTPTRDELNHDRKNEHAAALAGGVWDCEKLKRWRLRAIARRCSPLKGNGEAKREARKARGVALSPHKKSPLREGNGQGVDDIKARDNRGAWGRVISRLWRFRSFSFRVCICAMSGRTFRPNLKRAQALYLWSLKSAGCVAVRRGPCLRVGGCSPW